MGKTNLSDKRSEVTWKFDFSDCGLVVRQFRVKGRCSDDDEIDWRVIGDERVGCRPMLAGQYTHTHTHTHTCTYTWPTLC